MADAQDIEFILGSTWPIQVACKDEDGATLVLQSTDDVQLRIATTKTGPVLFDLKRSGGDGVLIDANAGTYRFDIAAADQSALQPRNYRHEVRVVRADGTVIPQAFGVLTVTASLFDIA